jgi:hypothetical protein
MFGKSKKADVYDGPRWISELRSTVKNAVSDPDRAVKMVALVDKMEQELTGMDEEVKRFINRVRVLNADFDASRTDFEVVIGDFNRRRKEARARFLDLRFQLNSLSTTDEWKQIANREKTVMEIWQSMPEQADTE